jgi:hypothetical protein
MRVWRNARLIALLSTLAALSTSAGATSRRVPVPVARRPMTLPNATLRLDDGPYWPLPSGLVETTFYNGADDSSTRLNFGFGIGFTRDFEMGAHIVKWQIDPGSDFADPSIYAMYRFLDGDFELGIYAEATLPFDRAPLIIGGMPLGIHLGDVVRIDTGPFVVHSFAGGPNFDPRDDPDFGPGDDPDLIVPFQLPISIHRLTLGPEAALIVPDFQDDYWLVGFFVGYTLTSHGATLGDLGGRFRTPPASDFDTFTVMFEMQFFFDF